MREVVPVPFGAGLDRATGALATNPASFWDLRNVILKDDKLEVRGGLTQSGALLTAVGDVVGIFPFRAIKAAVAVGYNRTTRQLTVWRLDATGGWIENLGVWATLIPGAELAQPIVVAAEHKGLLFLAHDEPLYNFRAQTHYFNPALPVGAQLVGLTADFNGDSINEAVYFRGVRQYLSYMWGWGHGAESRPNAPEVVRFSEGAAPTTWPKNYYFIAGAADEAVTNCAAAGNRLVVMKKGETHAIDGNNAQNFSIRPIEQVYGTINARLGVELGGAFFYWSETGPRVTTGQESIDLGLPLELDAPEPPTLPAKGEEFYGWCVQDPLRRIIAWGFPEIVGTATLTRVYVLSVRDPERFKWSYMEIGQHVHAVGLVVEGAPIAGTELTGWASNLMAVDDGLYQTGRQLDLQWTNNSLIGGELAEVWRQLGAGPWEIVQLVPVSGASQQATINGPNKPFQALANYNIAIRYIKDGRVTPGFEGGPSTWTHAQQANSKTTVQTTAEAPVINTISWERIDFATTRLTFNITQAELEVGFELEDSADGVGGWAVVKVFAAPENGRALTYDPPNSQLSTTRYYRMRAERIGLYGPYSNVKSRWIGPDTVTAIPGLWIFQATDTATFQLFIKNIPSGHKLDVETGPDGTSTWTRVYFAAPGYLGLTPLNVVSSEGIAQTYVRARFAFTDPGTGIDDFGDWSAVGSILLTAAVPLTQEAPFTVAEWNAPNDIYVEWTPGARRLIVYKIDGFDINVVELDDVTDNYTFINFGHDPTGDDVGSHFDYLSYTGTQPVDAVAHSWALDRAGGGAKISVTVRVEAVPQYPSGPPTAIAIVFELPGKIRVDWTAGRADDVTDVRWSDTFIQGQMVRLGVPPVLPVVQIVGPQLGYKALPASGDIKVRIYHMVDVGGTYYRTKFDEDLYSIP